MALVWGCVTPVSTSRGDQPLVLGGPITGAAHEVVWADGGRCRGHGKLITRKRLQSSHGGVSQVYHNFGPLGEKSLRDLC